MRQGKVVDSTAPTDVEAVVRAAWSPVSEPEVSLAVGDLPTVAADRDRLRQLLENLPGNAVEHGSTSNHSQARDDAVEHGAIEIRVGSLPDGGGFFVADDGLGIPENERERVFERGYTTREEGTGFGLAIVRAIAEAHGWSASVGESEAGGARFEVAVE